MAQCRKRLGGDSWRHGQHGSMQHSGWRENSISHSLCEMGPEGQGQQIDPQNGTMSIFISLDFLAQIEEAPSFQYMQNRSSLWPHGTSALSKGPLDVPLMFPPKSGYSNAAKTKRSATNMPVSKRKAGITDTRHSGRCGSCGLDVAVHAGGRGA